MGSSNKQRPTDYFPGTFAVAGSCYLVFFTPRSGSSWLADRLRATGFMGHPDEWLNPGFLQFNVDRFGARSESEFVVKLRTSVCSSNGLFGCQLTAGDLNFWGSEVLRFFHPIRQIFCLLRRDLVAQAVSLYSAVETGVFHLKGEDRRQAPPAPPYDSIKLGDWMRHILYQEISLVRVIEALNVQPILIWHEDLVHDMHRVVDAMCLEVCSKHPEGVAGQDHRKIASREHHALADQFARDSSGPVHELELLRSEFVLPWLQRNCRSLMAPESKSAHFSGDLQIGKPTLSATSLESTDAASTLLSNFEALGDNCEFGIVQRYYGIEPLGLLRWAGAGSLDVLLRALNDRFSQLGELEFIEHRLLPGWPRPAAIDLKYGFYFHTDVTEQNLDEHAIPDDIERESRRLIFLRNKLISDLEGGEKIIVYRRKAPLDDSELERLFASVQNSGPSRLLCVQERPGHVGEKVSLIRPGFAVGFINSLSNENPPRVDFESWLQICRAASALLSV